MTNGTIPPPPGAAPKKKGLPTLAWVGLGCLALILIGALTCVGGVAFFGNKAKNFVEKQAKEAEENPVAFAGKMYAAVNPDIEFVSADESSEMITLRNKKTGETVTINYADIKDGRVSVDTGNGKVTFGAGTDNDLPEWVPSYPGASVTGNFSGNSGNSLGGTVTLETSDSAQDVFDFYRSQLEAGGYKISTQSFSAGEQSTKIVTGNLDDPKRTFTATVTSNDGKTGVLLAYSEGGD